MPNDMTKTLRALGHKRNRAQAALATATGDLAAAIHDASKTMTQAEIARLTGYSHEGVRQILHRAEDIR